ncbi:MAG: 1-deoxy-D-xylulose-5-phosphate synthase [bacterium]|nr:1-deoxy-D-xylulose-5-phosphate synthase [bacterium]
MKYQILDKITSPSDIKDLGAEELKDLAKELRAKIIDVVSERGGHLAPNLGAVELTIALHRVFDTPKDKIVWDVGHQSYGHKLLTGRFSEFDTLRTYNGISGFPRRSENRHDAFGTGHASTSISAALGIAAARDMNKEDYSVIAVIGDGGLTGGVAYEGLDHAGELMKNLLVILNDNDMSISPNVGGISHYLNRIISSYYYNKTKEGLDKFIEKSIGQYLMRRLQKVEETIKALMVPGVFFEELGFRYFGPINGHDLRLVEDTLRSLKDLKGPLLLHVITEKGHGYEPAVKDPTSWHGAKPFDKMTGEPKTKVSVTMATPPPSYTQVFSKVICKMAEKNKNVAGITAAMAPGTGLSALAKKFPDQFFDVGIAEQHAVLLAAGMATEGIRPVVAIYSTFLQRAYDQVYHDVCIQNLPVILAIDRGGLVGDDGATHQGLYDTSYLRAFPNIVVSAAADERDLARLLWTGLAHNGPFAVRYPRANGEGVEWSEEEAPLPIGKGEILRKGSGIAILGYGYMVHRGMTVADLLEREGIHATVVNMRFAKPIDREMLVELAQNHQYFVSYEDNTLAGGFSSAVSEALHDLELPQPLLRLALPDEIIEHGQRSEMFREHGLLPEQVCSRILKFIHAKSEAVMA